MALVVAGCKLYISPYAGLALKNLLPKAQQCKLFQNGIRRFYILKNGSKVNLLIYLPLSVSVFTLLYLPLHPLTMRCLIVDDNKLARMAMKQLVGQVKSLELVAECSDAMEAYNHLNNKDVDLLLLDIEMPGMTGLELTKKLGNKSPLIIFTTSKTDYAVEAFELNVVDYLVKPVMPARFMQAIEKTKEVVDSTRADAKAPVAEQEFVFVKTMGF
jgi:CheY-like chemotaxis protein